VVVEHTGYERWWGTPVDGHWHSLPDEWLVGREPTRFTVSSHVRNRDRIGEKSLDLFPMSWNSRIRYVHARNLHKGWVGTCRRRMGESN
jgi:hypothetical protein